jgi:hypothetical protein|tara:strand:+ start:5511 stop:5993 length:483 start_codon:yes stop_codon:yes gene_type:complete
MPNSNMFNNESREAAESIAKMAPALRFRIENWVRLQGEKGATSDEVLVHFDIAYQTGSARVTELKQAGKIVPSGRRRRTRTGRWAAVLVHRSVAIDNDDQAAPTKHTYDAISNWALVVRSEVAILEEAARFQEPERVREEWLLTLRSWRKLRGFVREVIS